MERCCARLPSGRRCRLRTLGYMTCYGIDVYACHHHRMRDIINDWSVHTCNEYTPEFIRKYLIVFSRCYYTEHLPIKLSIAIATELHAASFVDGEMLPQYLKIIFRNAPKKEDCPICLSESDFMVSTRCDHIFCAGCIIDWCVTGNPNCPVCRSKL